MKPFQTVKSRRPGRSVFDLSYSKLFTCDMGQLIPIMHDEMVPGDKFKIATEIVVRFQPLVAPVLHEINATVHYFFVPYRLLWSDWENYITGGPNGTDSSVLPLWNDDHNNSGQPNSAEDSLWDYMGLPVIAFDADNDMYPVDFPRRAYNFIFDEYYRDETLQQTLMFSGPDQDCSNDNDEILYRNWTKDYFTSALPFQQRGTAPALPLSGTTNADFALSNFSQYAVPGAVSANLAMWNGAGNVLMSANTTGLSPADMKATFDNNTVDFADALTFNVADIRLAFQIQKWLERNARAGARYVEFLHSHFGVAPKDARLQRPEYIGGIKTPVIISEVLQTSSTVTASPQGNMAGHGLSVDHQYAGDYFATEYGVMVGILSIMPKPMYCQGINRQWLKQTKYDFYFPEFANLSEQPIYDGELYTLSGAGYVGENWHVFGYQGRYDEMRYKPSVICSKMKSDFDFWHLARIFGSAPSLVEDFIQCVPDKRIFAAEDEPGLIVHIANKIKAIRPIPIQSEPGLIDH